MSDAPGEPVVTKKKKASGKPRALNLRQQAFCEHYVASQNGVQAARLAGYTGSPDVLAQMSCQNLRLPQIQKYLGELRQKISTPRILDAQRWLELLSEIVTGEAQGKALSFGALVDDRPSFGDKIRAAELMAKMLGELTENRNTSGEVVIRVERSNKSAISIGERDE